MTDIEKIAIEVAEQTRGEYDHITPVTFAKALIERLTRDGFVLVPKEPTSIMLKAAIYGDGRYYAIYKAMIAAAPKPEELK